MYFTSESLNQSFKENTPTTAVNRFWYEQKSMLVDKGTTLIPLKGPIHTLDIAIGDQVFEAGVYYFKTHLVIDQLRLNIDTVVKPIDGIWTVDINDTFMGAHISALDHHIHNNLASNKHLSTILKEEYIWGMGQTYSVENEAALRVLIAERLKQFEDQIIKTYISTSM